VFAVVCDVNEAFEDRSIHSPLYVFLVGHIHWTAVPTI